MLGKKLKDFPELVKRQVPWVGVKEAVFPFNMFPEVDPLLGPEMRATGEVMGMGDSFGLAFYKAEEATGVRLPEEGNVLITVADRDKKYIIAVAKRLKKVGFTIYATKKTNAVLRENGVESIEIHKIDEGRPDITDFIKNRDLHLIINTPLGSSGKEDDGYIRRMAIQYKIPYITTVAAAEASVEGIEAMKKQKDLPKSLQEYHGMIK
jgi:carbamoyl-phosphate synthase large subunit